jgi:hypothetical protein
MVASRKSSSLKAKISTRAILRQKVTFTERHHYSIRGIIRLKSRAPFLRFVIITWIFVVDFPHEQQIFPFIAVRCSLTTSNPEVMMAKSHKNLPNLHGIFPSSSLAVIFRNFPPSPKFPSQPHFSGIFQNNPHGRLFLEFFTACPELAGVSLVRIHLDRYWFYSSDSTVLSLTSFPPWPHPHLRDFRLGFLGARLKSV